MDGRRDHCWYAFWIWTLQMRTSPTLSPLDPPACCIRIFWFTIGYCNTLAPRLHRHSNAWTRKSTRFSLGDFKSDTCSENWFSSKQSKHSQCKKIPPSSSVCPLLPFSQTRLSHKGFFLWSETCENNHMERLGYIKMLCGFVRHNPLVFSFKYLQLWIIFIEKQNIATKSFLAKISGPFCIILSVSWLLRPPLLHWN